MQRRPREELDDNDVTAQLIAHSRSHQQVPKLCRCACVVETKSVIAVIYTDVHNDDTEYRPEV